MIFSLKKPSKIHFIGIGGIGVSSLAQWFLNKKYKISGSDISKSEIINYFKHKKITIYHQHKKSNIKKDIALVIYSNAILNNNPEIIQAKKLNIPVLSYPQALGLLTKKYQTIAISGSHGKSTTTALISLIFKAANLNPNVIIGTKIKDFKNKNFLAGKSNYLIIEADEYKAAFLNYSPFLTVILNLDKEHLDFYKNLKKLKKTFLLYIKNIKKNGLLFLNKDDKNLLSLKSEIEKIKKQNNLNIYWISLKQELKNQTFVIKKIKKNLKIFGYHNLENALMAYYVAKYFKIKDEIILKVFQNFQGAWRRLELKKTFYLTDSNIKINIFDDYAHHPTEVKASLEALKQKFPDYQTICLFQPHQNKRLKYLFNNFKKVFSDADFLIIYKTYYVKGRDKNYKNYNSYSLFKELKKHKNKIFYSTNFISNFKILKKILKNEKNKKYNLIIMGAGNINDFTPLFLKKIKNL